MPRLFIITLVLALTSCSKPPNSSPSPQPASTSKPSVAGAPADYIKASVNGGQRSKANVELAVLRKAIESFEVQEERRPQRLEELVEKSILPQLPKPPSGYQIQYDPARGEVQLIQEHP